MLIVEDEVLLAMDLEAILEGEGFEVIDFVRSVETALDAIKSERPDFVTLDMNLAGESSRPIAVQLTEERIPFVLLSGYTSKVVADSLFTDVPLIRKPFETKALLKEINEVTQQPD